ncbi:MAG: peptidoglycan bridge formation glycyltransferase FemA/FemB family protein [Thermomicrobium sp.]|nr:peptidoglycan bridge formation glycyltransferase FemA/FemB family protein [Thermomicrobium sp.]MDW8059964.1 peptidoglycan bridge formation glycyltransferase FemA/FemB family protein [Thermomicrobium sp.]
MVNCRIAIATDPAEWNRRVARLGGRLLQSWQWGEFKRRHGWKPYRFALDAPRAQGAAQVLVRESRGVSLLYVPRGPLCDRPDAELARALHEVLERLARETRAIVILAEPENDRGMALLDPSLGWQPSSVVVQPRRTLRVPLDDDDQLLSRMKPKTRYNIRLAFRRGVTTRIADANDVDAFYDILRETARRDGFGIHRVEYFRDLVHAFGSDAALIFAEFEGQLAAAALVVRFADEAVYLYGASRSDFQRHMAAYAVQWAAMQWARAMGCRWYDLWGIPEDDAPPPEASDDQQNVRSGLWGVYRFKLGFGGHPYTYPGVRELVRNPLLVALWRRWRPLGA